MYRTVSDVYVSIINPGSRLDCTLATATLSVNVGTVQVMACCRELERSTMLVGQFWTAGGVTSEKIARTWSSDLVYSQVLCQKFTPRVRWKN